MKAFIKFIDGQAWKSILTKWSPPTSKNATGETILKNGVNWTDEKNKVSSYNSTALNAIFIGVTLFQFKSNSKVISAKEALGYPLNRIQRSKHCVRIHNTTSGY